MAIRSVDRRFYRFGNMVGLWTLIEKEVQRFASVYMQSIVAPVITALLYYTIFALAFGGAARDMNGVPFLDFLAPGLIMMSMIQNAFVNTSSSLVISKMQGAIIDVFMPPLSAFEIFLGYTVGAVLRGLAVGVLAWFAMMVFIEPAVESFVLVVVYAILGNFLLASLGMMAGIWADKFDQIATISNFIVTPLSFLSGTFYAIETLPEFWQFLAQFNPFYYMIDGFRAGFIGVGDTSHVVGVTLLLVINALLAAGILIMLRTGYKIKA